MSAHTFGQMINVVTIFALPFVAVKHWGVDGYGIWLTLTAVTQIFMLTDLGWSLAIQNQLCMKADRKVDDASALVWFVINNVLKKWLFAITLITIIAAFAWNSIVLSIFPSQPPNTASAFFALALFASLQPYINVYSGVWRYMGRHEYGVLITNSFRLFELIIIIGSILLNQSLTATAVSSVTVRIIIILAMVWHIYHMLKVDCNTSVNDGEYIDRNELRTIKEASYGFTLIQISQQIYLNGPLIIIAAILGPVTAAVFAACRTLSRIPVLPISMFLISLAPELTALSSAKKYQKIRTTVKAVSIANVFTVFASNILMLIFIQQIEMIWFKGMLNIDVTLLIVLCSSSTILVVNQTISQSLLAANLTRIQGWILITTYLTVAILSTCLLVIFQTATHVAYMLILAECFILITSFEQFSKVYPKENKTAMPKYM